MERELRKFPGNALRRQHEIDASGQEGALRHAVEFGRFGFLGESNSSGGLDRLESQGSVRSGSGQNHANCQMPLSLGQSAEEMIDRQVAPGGGFAAGDPEGSVGEAQVGVCGNHIDVVGLHVRGLADFGHRHFRYL